MQAREKVAEAGLRRLILQMLKERGSVTIAEVAGRANTTYEGVRQQMVALEEEGIVAARLHREEPRVAGRPKRVYALTAAGEHLFPKAYDALGVELLETLRSQLGIDALRAILASLTEARVRRWEPLLDGLSLDARIEALKGLYIDDDPFMDVERGPDGIRLIERNCPFFNVASAHPALCSVSVSVLMRLLGVKVIREERFQAGDRRCVFRLLPEQPIDPSSLMFEFEPAA